MKNLNREGFMFIFSSVSVIVFVRERYYYRACVLIFSSVSIIILELAHYYFRRNSVRTVWDLTSSAENRASRSSFLENSPVGRHCAASRADISIAQQHLAFTVSPNSMTPTQESPLSTAIRSSPQAKRRPLKDAQPPGPPLAGISCHYTSDKNHPIHQGTVHRSTRFSSSSTAFR